LSGWSRAQKDLADSLSRSGVPLKVFIITDEQTPDDIPAQYVPLPINRIQEVLSAL
jgi:hypothetical protein